VHHVAVIDNPAAAEASLDPIRARLLAELAEPGSASTLAARVGLTRQKANYHLRALERHGLVELVEERRKGNCTERVLQATAASYVISPSALPAVAPDPSQAPDQRSARWLLAVAGRLVREVGELISGASTAGRPLATLGIDSEVRFASATDRAAFAADLSDAVNGLVAKYHDETAPGGRSHRFVVALHPTLTNPNPNPNPNPNTNTNTNTKEPES
jgi:DNA-binding transcriptional ArsR family regulator